MIGDTTAADEDNHHRLERILVLRLPAREEARHGVVSELVLRDRHLDLALAIDGMSRLLLRQGPQLSHIEVVMSCSLAHLAQRPRNLIMAGSTSQSLEPSRIRTTAA